MSYYSSYGYRRRRDPLDIGLRVAAGVLVLGLAGGGTYLLVDALTAPSVEEVEVCATKPADPNARPVRADQALCDTNTPGYGSYTWQLPDDDDHSSLVIVGVGQPLPIPGSAGSGRYARPTTSRVLRPAPQGVTASKSNITRGGLGVPSSSSSGGAKGGSSGS